MLKLESSPDITGSSASNLVRTFKVQVNFESRVYSDVIADFNITTIFLCTLP